MAPTDRYVFAKVDPDAGPKALHLTKPTDIPAPSPEDWQAIVDAVDRGRQHNAPDIAVAIAAGAAAIAAIRNMREAQQ